MKKYTFLFAVIGALSLFTVLHADWVLIDGSRNFSHAMALHLIDQGERCTLVVKPEDMAHINHRFKHRNMLDVVEFDYTQEVDFTSKEGLNRLQPLLKAMEGKKFLYLDPEHHVYGEWHTVVQRTTLNALFCAQRANLNIFYAGRIYPFSSPEFSYNPEVNDVHTHITNTHEPHEIKKQYRTDQGRTMGHIEDMLKTVANNPANKCKVRIIRTSYPFGCGVNDYLLSSSFKEMPTIGRMTWLFDIDKPYQFCFTTDAARLAYHVSQLEWDDHFSCITFKGYDLNSVRTFGEHICHQANALNMNPYGQRVEFKPRVVSKLQLRAVSLFKKNAKRGIDLADFFTSPRKLAQSIAFKPTPLEQAIQTTLRWYEVHNNVTDVETRGIFQP